MGHRGLGQGLSAYICMAGSSHRLSGLGSCWPVPTLSTISRGPAKTLAQDLECAGHWTDRTSHTSSLDFPNSGLQVMIHIYRDGTRVRDMTRSARHHSTETHRSGHRSGELPEAHPPPSCPEAPPTRPARWAGTFSDMRATRV